MKNKKSLSKKKVGILVGSLRRESLNLKMANALIELAPDSLEMELVDVSSLPLYNEDLDEKPPKTWLEFRRAIPDYDAILFVTPEYNRSVPAVLKNAIDVGSRPPAKSVWKGKPAAIVSVSPSALGAFGANHHLRQSLVFLDMPTLQQPEAYIGHANDLFSAAGKLKNAKTKEFMQKFLAAFETWILQNG